MNRDSSPKISQLMMEVFVEQALASSRSARNIESLTTIIMFNS